MHAMIFDFDGVIVDSEPIHFRGFQQVLSSVGIELTHHDYYTRYLGYDDHDCLAVALRDHGQNDAQTLIARLIARKTQLVQREIAESIKPLPGAVTLVRQAVDAGIPLAICSGALRKEIQLACRRVGLEGCFQRIVAAEDVAHGKPDPEGYRLALRQLSERNGRRFNPARCVVAEDSPAGIASGRAAGMRVLAVTTSYDSDALQQADRIVNSLEEVSLDMLEELLKD